MALKYYAYFNSTAWAGVTSTRYKIEIYDTTFSGTATEVTTGANPFSEKELNNEETTYGIKSCRFDIDIVSDVVTVEDFYTQEGMSHRVKLYEAPLVGDMTLIRDGYLLSEDVQEVYQDGTKVIQLSGTDGLELLKTIPFEFSADKPYTGVMTGLLLLDRCITPIGLELNVNTSFNYYQDGQSKIASFEPLAFFNVHAPLFKGKTCYEALNMLCETLRCVIFQEDGEWWFIHTLNPDNTTQYYRKWDSDFNSLSSGTLPSAITVEFEGEYAPCNDPKKLKKRSYKSVTTDVDIQDYINKLRNPDFTSGITEWVDGGVDSYASGGDGTNLNPYYLQINGYQNKTALDFLNIKYVSQNVATLYDVTTDDSISGKLDTSIKVSGKVLGDGVKFGNVGLFLRIETDSPLAPNLILCLSDSGEWIHLGLTQTAGLSGVLDVITGIKFNILKNIISIPLTDSDGVQIDDWKGFEIESKNISEIVLNMNKSIGFIDNIIGGALEQFYQIDVEDFTKVELYMVIYEGYDNTVGSSDPRNIKYGNLNLEIKDKSRLVGLKKDRYFSEQSTPAPNKLEVNAYFSDFQDNTQLISMLQSDEVTPTILWEDSSGNNVGELMMGLNRELLSLYYKPTSLYDGDILGKVKKYHKINLVEFANELINLNWNFDFGEGIASGVRYIMTFANYGTFTNTKYGIYSDDKQIKYDGNYPTGIYEFDQVPALKPDLIARNLLEIKASSLFSDGYATFSKINPKSGIQWFDAANNKTDYFLTTEDGFVMKSETNPYEVTLDFTELTANTKLIIPPLSADAYLLTSENGWVLEGNNISTAKKLGSTTAQDWTIINNDTTVATVKEGFLDLGDNKLGLGKVNFLPTTAQDITDAGDLAWDADRKTLSLRFNGDHGHVMQDQFYYVKNQTGSTITKGSFVGFAGSLGASGILLISKFIANNTTDSQNFMGVAHEDIPNGGDGRVIHFGEVRGIDLTGIADGTKLYASTTTAGAWQTTVPVAPNNIILVAAVKNGGSNGSIHVRPTIGSKLANDESVLFGTLANNNLLAYESATSLWKNKTYSELGLFPTPSGLTTNYVTKWNGTALANSQIFDSGTLIGLGTAIPATLLDVRGQISANIGSASSPTFSFVGDLNTGMYSSAADTINFATGGVNRASITSVGDVIIGSAAGTNSLIVSKNITGGTTAAGIRSSGQFQSDVTSDGFMFRSVMNQANFALPTLVGYESALGTISGTGTTLINFRAQATSASYTNVYGFQGSIASGTNRYNAFFNGTAQNHFRGNVGIGSGSTVPATELEVRGVISASLGSASLPSHTFVGDLNNGWWSPAADTQAWSLSGAEVMRLNSTGLGIGVTPSYKLDVAGTGHFTGAVTFDTVPSSLQDATTSNHLVRYSQFIAATYLKPYNQDVKTVSFTSLTKSGLYAINGYTPTAGQYVLDAFGDINSGIWVVASGAWSRATDADSDPELRGFVVSISQGTYAGYKYYNTNNSAISMGSTAITYSVWSNVTELDPVFTAWRDTTRSANTFWAAPNGSNGAATWRTLVAADVPTLNQSTTGSAATLTTARSIGMTGDVDWSVSFNGSGNVTAAGTLASVNSDIGTFNNVTVNAKGLVTAASNVSYLTGNQTITISGDASGIGSTSIALTLATVATAGTYRSVTINAKGLVTSGTNPTTLSGYGITDAQPLDGDLTAIAGLTGTNGLLRKTDTNTWILDTNSYFQTPTGLTTNYVTKWNGSALANSTIFDNGSIGIGTVNPTYKLDIVDATGIILRHSATANTSGAVRFIGGSYTGNGMTGIVFGANLNNNQLSYGGGTSLAEPATQHIFFTGTYGTKASGTEVFRIANNGNVGINSSNPSYKLDVVGTGRFTDNVIIGSSGAGVNSLIINKVLTTLGNGADASTLRLSGTIQSDVTGNAFQLRSLVSTQATPFNITNLFHISTAVSSIGAGSTITNQYGLFIDASLTQATNNYGLWSAISSGTNRWNLYMAGTAQNYIAGNLGIGSGTTTPSEALHLTGNIRYSGTLKPSNTAGTNGQFLKTNGTADSWATLTTSDISNLSSYTGLDVRYFTETESDARFVALSGSYGNPSWITSLAWSKITGVPSTFEPSAHTLDSHSNVTITSNSSGEILKWDGSKWINNTLSEAGIQATLGGTGIVKSTGGVISYLTDNTSNWNTAYGWGNHASAGYLTTSLATTTYQPLDGDLTAIAGLSGTSGFLKKTAANTWILDTSTYLSGNQTITLSGIVTGSGTTSITTSIADNALSIAKTSGLQTALDGKFATPSGLTTNYVSKWNGTAFANSQLFDNGTSIGVATASPSATSKLHVNNAAGNSVRFQNTYFSNTLESNTSFARGGIFNNAEYIDEGGATKVWKIRNYGANDAAGILFSNSGTLNFISVPSTGTVDKSLTHSELLSNARMTILSSGFVGINTTSPAYTLDVVGTIRTTNLLITSGAAVGSFLKANNVNGTSVWSSITTSDISNLSSWAGSTSITTLGTIASGTWNATTIGITKGGTGLTALGTANQLLRVNSGATALEYFTPTYISGNQTITLSGVVTGSGTTAITTSIADSALSIAKTSGLQTALDGKQATLGGTGFVKSTGGVISYDTSTYLTANQTITLSGDVSGSGATSITATLATITQASTGNFRKITLDTKGRVTGNTAVVIGDLTALGATTLTSFSSSATGLTYTNTTGVFSLTSGYSIPTTANQTNWNTAYGWGNHASAGYLTTSTAASTYQPLLPSGTAGQFLIRNASNQLEFSTLELEPVSLSNNKIAVGDSANYLSEYNNFEFLESRFISIYRPSDNTRALYMGMDSLSNNSFITAAGGHLTLKGDTGIYLHGFTGFGNKMVIVDGDGKLGYTDIPSGGGGGSSSLTSTYIGYGSSVNTLTGNSTFTYLDNRYIHLTSSGSDFNLGTFSSAGFIESVNGNLLLQARSTFGVVVDEGYFQVDTLGGGGTKMVVVDNNGKFGTQTIPSGGGSVGTVDQVLAAGNTSYERTFNLENSTTNPYLHFKNNSGTLKGNIIHIDNVLSFNATTGNKLQLSSGADLDLLGTNINIGYSNTTGIINIQGMPFNFNEESQNGGSGANGSQWGSGFNQGAPVAGDRMLFFYDGTRWVPSHIHTYAGAGGKTYLTID